MIAAAGPAFLEFLHQWHEFYLLAGTAAVTLAGLLFVSLSLHLEQLVEASHEHLLALSRVTLVSYVLVMNLSLFMLVPGLSSRVTGALLTLLGIAGIVVTSTIVARTQHHEEGGFTRRAMRKRTLFTVVGYVLVAVAGLGVILGIPEMLYQMMGGVCTLLGNAAGTSWELLVRVAQHRRRGRSHPVAPIG